MWTARPAPLHQVKIELRLAGRLQAQLSFAEVQEIATQDVVEYLRDISQQLQHVNGEIFHQYFDYPIVAALAASS